MEFKNTGIYSVMPECLEFAERLTKKYGQPISSGRNRVVWRTGKGHVIKVPRCYDGIVDNEWEACTSYEYHAKTKLLCIPDTRIDICLMQEVNLDHGIPYKKLPDWTTFIDCSQVGLRNGKLLAYDFGIR